MSLPDPISKERSKRRAHSSPLLLTPLVDIIFLVALFFIIHTGMPLVKEIDITLPEGKTGEESLDKQLTVSIDSNEALYIDGNVVEWSKLETVLQDIVAQGGYDTVLIRGDQDISYKRLISVMDSTRNIGIFRISLLIEGVSE